MSLLVVLAVCAAAVAVLWAPFRRARSSPDAGGSEPAALDAPPPTRASAAAADVLAAAGPEELRERRDEKDRVFQSLADLRFDYESGKLSRADFEAEDAALRVRAARALRDLEGEPPGGVEPRDASPRAGDGDA